MKLRKINLKSKIFKLTSKNIYIDFYLGDKLVYTLIKRFIRKNKTKQVRYAFDVTYFAQEKIRLKELLNFWQTIFI